MATLIEPAGRTVLKWDHWHIECSSICALQCARCPRVEVPESLLNRQLTLAFFQQQIGSEVVKHIRKITFCGNDGDPIYCRDLLMICAWLKEVNPVLHLVIITNGSYRPAAWWSQLGRTLDLQDEIHWSLDGWDQASNEQYRTNSSWRSIQQGREAFAAANHSTYQIWAAIAFRFNQDHLDHMRKLAQESGMDLFQLTKSTKFGSHYPETYGVLDTLCPDLPELVSSSHRFERVLTALTDRPRPASKLQHMFWLRAQDLVTQQRHSGICLIGNKGVFLNSLGEFFPCCWTANRYEHNAPWHELARTKFNLWQHSFEHIIRDAFWSEDFLEFDSPECRTKCTPEKLKDRKHTTQW